MCFAGWKHRWAWMISKPTPVPLAWRNWRTQKIGPSCVLSLPTSALLWTISCPVWAAWTACHFQLSRERTSSQWKPVSTYLVLLFKRQQLAQESAPRSLSLKLAGVIPSEGHHYLVLLTPYISPGGMQLNTGQRSALLSGGLPHFSEPQVGTVIILSLMDTCIAYLKLTINLSMFVCEYVHICVSVCACDYEPVLCTLQILMYFCPPNNPFHRW